MFNANIRFYFSVIKQLFAKMAGKDKNTLESGDDLLVALLSNY